MNNDYKMIFESYSKHVLEADNNPVQAGSINVTNPASIQPQQQVQPQAQPTPQPTEQPATTQKPAEKEIVTNQEINEISMYINSAYDAQIKLLDVLLQKGILDNASKNDLQSAAFGSLTELSRQLVYSAAQNDPQKINTLKTSFHKDIANMIQPPAQQEPAQQQTSNS